MDHGIQQLSTSGCQKSRSQLWVARTDHQATIIPSDNFQLTHEASLNPFLAGIRKLKMAGCGTNRNHPPLPVPFYPPVRLPLKTPHFLWAAHPVYLSGTSSLPSHMEPRHVSSLKVCLILLGSQQNGINPEVEELIVIVECPQKVDCLAPLFI